MNIVLEHVIQGLPSSSISRDHSPPLCFPSSSERPIQSHSRGGLLARQRGEAQVRLDDRHAREDLLGVLGLDAGVNDHIVATEEGK